MDRPDLVWIGVIVAVLVFLDLLFVELRRIVREGRRLVRRLLAYADSPMFELLASSEYDTERLVRAIEALPPLIERGQAALAALRFYKPKGSSPG